MKYLLLCLFLPIICLLTPTTSNLFDKNIERNSLFQFKTLPFYSSSHINLDIDQKESVIKGGYEELRNANEDTLSDIIIIEDWNSVYEGDSFLQKGGVFYKSNTGKENGGTIIVANSGQIWKRVHDGKRFSPHWWELGRKDHNGNAVIGNTSDNGIQSIADAIKNCVIVAPRGAVIDYLPVTYAFDRYIPIKNQQTHFGAGFGGISTKGIEAGGTVFTRCLIKSTILTSNANIGDVTMTVAEASVFKVGQKIVAYKDNGYLNQTSNSSATIAQDDGHTITSINGNVITFDKPVRTLILAGSKVLLTFEFFYKENVLSDSSHLDLFLNIEGIIFDGNRTDYGAVKDYNLNSSIQIWGGYITLRDCHFRNTPGENIESFAGHIENCSYEDLGGSFFHGSGLNANLPEGFRTIYIENIRGDGSNSVPNYDYIEGKLASGHSEGLFTFSQKVRNLKIIGGNIRNGGACILGHANDDDFPVYVSGLTATNFKGIFYQRGTFNAPKTNYQFINNYFDNCGEFEIIIGAANKKQGLRFVKYVGNVNINSRFYFEGVTDLIFKDNKIIADSTSLLENGGWASVNPENLGWATSGQKSVITITANSDRMHITGNTFSGMPDNDSELATGINIIGFSSTIRKDDLGKNTKYVYCQDFIIFNNTIEDFDFGIGVDGSIIKDHSTQAVGWYFDNNRIYSKRVSSPGGYTVGMTVPAGVIAKNNTIKMTGHNDKNKFGIIAQGVRDIDSNLQGAKIIGNDIEIGDLGASIVVGLGTPKTNNIMLFNNVSNGGTIRYDAPTGEVGQKNIANNNVQLNFDIPYRARVYENSEKY